MILTRALPVMVLGAACFATVAAVAGVGRTLPDESKKTVARELRIPAGKGDLYAREVGAGPPAIVLHGGPDFDTRYLLPEMDRLSDLLRLIYYDQRGRGRSAAGVQPEDVSMESEMSDLDAVRSRFGLERVTLLGHSWGTVLALEYAIRHPDRVSRLILMNPAPASRQDFLALLKSRDERSAGDLEKKKAIAATAGYKEGDPDAVAAYYRVHFKAAFQRPEDLERILPRFRASFTPEGVLKARAVEDRLVKETWLMEGYDLLSRLGSLKIPTLVFWGSHDFIPRESAAHVAGAIPGARIVTLGDCGHFAYFECPEAVHKEIESFVRGMAAPEPRSP